MGTIIRLMHPPWGCMRNFDTPGNAPLRHGQLLYTCIKIEAAAGVALKDCTIMISVTLSLMSEGDNQIIGAEKLRRHRIGRLCKEARDQGGVPSLALHSSTPSSRLSPPMSPAPPTWLRDKSAGQPPIRTKKAATVNPSHKANSLPSSSSSSPTLKSKLVPMVLNSAM
jgi:hypothetical protein